MMLAEPAMALARPLLIDSLQFLALALIIGGIGGFISGVVKALWRRDR